MVAERNRPIEEEWKPRGDWRNSFASVLSTFAYGVPWLVLLWRWPPFVSPPPQGLPPLSFTLGMGIGWFVAMVLLLVVVVPSVFARAGRGDLAWRWRGGAIHGAWVILPVASFGAGMLLPLSLGLRWMATVTLFLVELLAVLGLKRKRVDTNRSRAVYYYGRTWYRTGSARDRVDAPPRRLRSRFGGYARG